MCARVIPIKLKTADAEKAPDEPIEEYVLDIKNGTVSTLPYDRLMIHYRKQKAYKEELAVIRKGIAVLKKFYANLQSSALKNKRNTSVKSLSTKISKSMGLVDKKGNDLYLPDPLPRWIRRETVVLEKLAKETAKKSKVKKKKK